MNIVFFTQDDPFYVKIFFEVFLNDYHNKNEIKSIVISRPMGKKSKYQLAKQMFSFYGYYDFFKVGLKYAFFKMLANRNMKHKKPTSKTYSVRQVAELYDIPVMNRSDINSSNFIDFIKKYNADLFISVASPIIWKEALINTPNLGCINIHNAPLPNYRGMLPNFWQLYNNEKYAGITIHKIDVGIDTGDIIRQLKIKIEENDTLDSLIKRTKKKGAHLMIDTLHKYRNGTISPYKMSGKGSYYSFPKKQDVRSFKYAGKRLL